MREGKSPSRFESASANFSVVGYPHRQTEFLRKPRNRAEPTAPFRHRTGPRIEFANEARGSASAPSLIAELMLAIQAAPGSLGDEMRRRLYAAFDLGLRHGEIVKIQLKHVETWHSIRDEFVSRHIEDTGDPVVTQHLARHKRRPKIYESNCHLVVGSELPKGAVTPTAVPTEQSGSK